MNMPNVVHGVPSYEHLMGSPKPAHHGSQSKAPEPVHSGHPMSSPKKK